MQLNKNNKLLFMTIFLTVTILACGAFDSDVSTPIDTQATINAAVAATNIAQTENQVAIDTAVAATDSAQTENQTTTDTVVTATAQTENQTTTDTVVTATATASDQNSEPTAETNTVTMTEEELATLIDQSVNAAILASEQYANVAVEASADDTVTQEEVNSMQSYSADTAAAIAEAEALMNDYYNLYADVAGETVAELAAVNQSLQEIAAATSSIDDSITEISNGIAQGVNKVEKIKQLKIEAQVVNRKTDKIQKKLKIWTSNPKRGRGDKPGIPVKPVKPDKPGIPIKPDKPGIPIKPVKPDKPGIPIKPDKPGIPVKPVKPNRGGRN